ncbi:MAG: acyl-CoA thioesterase [Gemmataceae bacterium]|jgi:acyl-CoA thioester hydrolase|nr:acyl-CoA thioesterase [Gemmataceae bacterium]
MSENLNRKDPVQETGMVFEIPIRVRYFETDAMGVVHHAFYLTYFEEARVEALRRLGASYKTMEEEGFFLVITRVELNYKRPAYFEDQLSVRMRIERMTTVRIDHAYQIMRNGEVLVEGKTTLACVDRDGKPRPLPDLLRPTSARQHLDGPKG